MSPLRKGHAGCLITTDIRRAGCLITTDIRRAGCLITTDIRRKKVEYYEHHNYTFDSIKHKTIHCKQSITKNDSKLPALKINRN